jgi:hypothetical protein
MLVGWLNLLIDEVNSQGLAVGFSQQLGQTLPLYLLGGLNLQIKF